MYKLLLNRLLLFSLPLLIFFSIPISIFFMLDPFKILYDYQDFNNSVIGYNEDYIATERILKNKDSYTSFIFGSSRAGCGFQVTDWQPFLSNTDAPFLYATSNESIFGIYGKIKLIDRQNIALKNAIIVLDTDLSFSRTSNSNGHLFIKHPQVSGESESAFILEYLKDYIFTGFFIRHIDYLIFQKERPYMAGFLDFTIENRDSVYIPFKASLREMPILSDSASYYKEKLSLFYSRKPVPEVLQPKINSVSISYLKEIYAIFQKHATEYKIIISPLYNQNRFNEKDLTVLYSIFNKENIFDYSGKNTITENINNYYEPSHYRPHVGRQILNDIYKNQ